MKAKVLVFTLKSKCCKNFIASTVKMAAKKASLHIYGARENYGSYKGVIKREAVHKCTNKDYLPKAEPRANDHFT